MKLVLTEEEQFLQDTAKNFAAERSPISHFRNLRDTNDPILWDKDIWSEMVKLGWPGILIPEEYGGAGLPIRGGAVILETINRMGCSAAAGHAQMYTMGTILRHGSKEQKAEFLPKIACGEVLPTAVFTEPDVGSDLGSIKTKAIRENEVYKISMYNEDLIKVKVTE